MSDTNNMTYELSHTNNYLNKMDDVIKWLTDKGFSGYCSRYSKYRGHLDDYYNKGKINDLDDLAVRFERANTALQECIQIVQVYNAFKNENSKGFNLRLKNVVSGTDFYDKARKSDQPRDYLYELLISAKFYSLGYTIDFDHTTDVLATKGDIVVYAECKRIKSINKLEDNFKKACKQLSLVSANKKHYGIVFIDIYNCLSDKINDYEYSDILSMKNKLDTVFENEFRRSNSDLIERILTEYLDNVLGVAFTLNRCLWLSNITPQFYQNYKVLTSNAITDTSFKVLQYILN